jgi:hypothetical protein
LAGASCGAAGIPSEWADGIFDAPINVALLRKVAARLSQLTQTRQSPGPAPYFWPLTLPRNLFFLLVVLWHGFRRFAPPY